MVYTANWGIICHRSHLVGEPFQQPLSRGRQAPQHYLPMGLKLLRHAHEETGPRQPYTDDNVGFGILDELSPKWMYLFRYMGASKNNGLENPPNHPFVHRGFP